jgi:hypothetical protein
MLNTGRGMVREAAQRDAFDAVDIRRKLQLLPRQVEPKSIEKTHRISGNQTLRDAFRKWKLSASTVRVVNYRSKQTDTQRVRFNFHDSTRPPRPPSTLRLITYT